MIFIVVVFPAPFGPRKPTKTGRKEQIQEIMRMVGLSGMENRLLRNLSKGYKQRAGLAQAMIGYPEVLILDEPMVGLDPREILEIRTLLQKLTGEHTILLSSHILCPNIKGALPADNQYAVSLLPAVQTYRIHKFPQFSIDFLSLCKKNFPEKIFIKDS